VKLKTMMKYRVRCFKTAVLLIFIFVVASCSSKGSMQFCVVPVEGDKATECGTTFTTGEFRVLLNSKEPFGQERILFSLAVNDGKNSEPEAAVSVDVDPAATETFADIEVYNPGTYLISATTPDGEQIAGGKIILVDQ
jgi:hypothetical protein